MIKIVTYYGEAHDTWYLTNIDTSHVNMSLTESEGSGCVYHIEQLAHQPYYFDVKAWLSQPHIHGDSLNGKQYQTLNFV